MTQVQTLRKPVLNPTRNYDFLYGKFIHAKTQKKTYRDCVSLIHENYMTVDSHEHETKVAAIK